MNCLKAKYFPKSDPYFSKIDCYKTLLEKKMDKLLGEVVGMKKEIPVGWKDSKRKSKFDKNYR